MVVANLLNLHAGYNGLVTGNAWILILAIGLTTQLYGQELPTLGVWERFSLLILIGILLYKNDLKKRKMIGELYE